MEPYFLLWQFLLEILMWWGKLSFQIVLFVLTSLPSPTQSTYLWYAFALWHYVNISLSLPYHCLATTRVTGLSKGLGGMELLLLMQTFTKESIVQLRVNNHSLCDICFNWWEWKLLCHVVKLFLVAFPTLLACVVDCLHIISEYESPEVSSYHWSLIVSMNSQHPQDMFWLVLNDKQSSSAFSLISSLKN